MSHATYIGQSAKQLKALIAADPTQAPKVLAYLDAAIAAGKRRNAKSQALLASLKATPKGTQQEAPKRRATARKPATAPKPQPKAKAAPAASQAPEIERALDAGLSAFKAAFLDAYFAK